jgi:cytochrome b561
MGGRAARYTSVAIVLHWAIAFAILFMLPLGVWMHEQAEHGNASTAVFNAYQLHKSVGFTILALSLARLGWRLANPPPALPPHMPGWERFIAKSTHWLFYALMIGLPLSGWLYVSAGWSIHDDAPLAVPTRWFNLFGVPHLFGLDQASHDVREGVASISFTAHAVLAWAIIGLAVAHVAAALKHHLFDRDAVLAHMVPGLRAPGETEPAPKNPVRLAVLGLGGALIVASAAALVLAVAPILMPPPPAPSAPSTIEIVEPQAPAVPEQVAPAEPDAPSAWRVDTRSSTIGFGYTYEDDSGATPFNGRFTRWRADIRFDPDNLDASRVAVTIEPASASTGVAAHDGALPGEEWFDAAAHPTATFRTTRIRARDGGYEARGDLTIKGQTRSVDLPFRLTIDGDRAAMTGSLTLDRRDFGIGEGAGDDLISREIRIDVRVDADRVR